MSNKIIHHLTDENIFLKQKSPDPRIGSINLSLKHIHKQAHTQSLLITTIKQLGTLRDQQYSTKGRNNSVYSLFQPLNDIKCDCYLIQGTFNLSVKLPNKVNYILIK